MKATAAFWLPIALASMHGPLAQGQEGGAAPGAPAIEEILVTASKRGATSLMSTPIPVSVVSDELLENAKILSVASLDKQVPNLHVGDETNQERGSLNISMRGISSSNTSETGDPNVGFHVDGIYVSRPNAVGMLLFDVERIEVLRGPQGTTFGRNATIGAIDVITKKPDPESLSGSFEAEIGSYEDRVLRGVLNLPIGEQLALRVTAMRQTRDTFQDLALSDLSEVDPWIAEPYGGYPDWVGVPDPNFTDLGVDAPDRSDHFSRQAYRAYAERFGGDIEDYGAADHWAYRISGRWAPSDNFSWNLSWENYQNDAPWAAGSVVCEADLCGKYPAYRGQEERSGPFSPRVNAPGFLDQSNRMLRSTVEYAAPGLASLKWNFGDSAYEHALFLDVSRGTGEFDSYFDETWKTDSRSHELQIISLHGGRLSWVAGYFDFKEQTSLALASIFQPYGWEGFVIDDLTAKSQAVYADLGFSLTEQLELTLGGRRTWDERFGGDSLTFISDGSLRTYPQYPPPDYWPPVHDPMQDPILQTDWLTFARQPGNWWENARPVAESEDFFGAFYDSFNLYAADGPESKFDYDDFKVGINYQPREDVFLFASFATGHKAGGSSRGSTFVRRLGESLPRTYGPEKVEDIELGIKSFLFDGRLRLQANYFNAVMKGKQEQTEFDYGDLYCDLNGDGDHGDPGEREEGCGAGGPVIVDVPPQTPPAELPPGHSVDDYLFTNQVESQIVTNAAKVKFSGLELDFVLDISPDDQLSGYATWLKNSISGWATDDLYQSVTRYHGASAGRFRNVPLDGNAYDFAPKFSLNLNYRRIFRLPGGSTLTSWLSMTWYDDYYLTPFNYGRVTQDENGDPIRDYEVNASGVPIPRAGEVTSLGNDFVKAHATFDLWLSWSPATEGWRVSAWVTNLTDEEVATGLAPTFKLPRTYGAKVGYSF